MTPSSNYKVKTENPPDRGTFYLYVHDLCKSAGTLLALGASTLIMSQESQLGPIDVQLLKEEEVGERRSGLTPRVALETLAMEAGSAFNRLFRYMRFDSRMMNLQGKQELRRPNMKSRKPSLEDRVQRERDRAADKHDPMLREIRNLRDRNKGVTEAWNRKRSKTGNEGEQELERVFLGDFK